MNVDPSSLLFEAVSLLSIVVGVCWALGPAWMAVVGVILLVFSFAIDLLAKHPSSPLPRDPFRREDD